MAAQASNLLGKRVVVLESHYAVGGAAHGFSRKTDAGEFRFDTGPSFFAGLTTINALNPLAAILELLGEPRLKNGLTYFPGVQTASGSVVLGNVVQLQLQAEGHRGGGALARRARRQQCGDGRREGLRVARAQASEREWEGAG